MNLSLPTTLLEAIAAEVESRREALMTTRCLSRRTLTTLIGAACARVGEAGLRTPAAKQLIALMQRAELLHQVSIDVTGSDVKPDQFFLLGFALNSRDVHPFELLQAHEPDGVVSFMAALQAHELTTQYITHFHVAKPRPVAARPAPVTRYENAPDQAQTAHTGWETHMGALQFSFDNLPYYATQRDARYLAAVQIRTLSPESRYRVTALEQTLIDTLDRPSACGGPGVVFEAWDLARDRINPRRLAALMNQISNLRLIRRVGAMLSGLGLSTDEVSSLAPPRGITPIELVDGVHGDYLDPVWQVRRFRGGS